MPVNSRNITPATSQGRKIGTVREIKRLLLILPGISTIADMLLNHVREDLINPALPGTMSTGPLYSRDGGKMANRLTRRISCPGAELTTPSNRKLWNQARASTNKQPATPYLTPDISRTL
jgi:hypothetical protein